MQSRVPYPQENKPLFIFSEEDGTISNGLMDDIKELVNLAKELEFDENQSFFSKVEAVTEGKFILFWTMHPTR